MVVTVKPGEGELSYIKPADSSLHRTSRAIPVGGSSVALRSRTVLLTRERPDIPRYELVIYLLFISLGSQMIYIDLTGHYGGVFWTSVVQWQYRKRATMQLTPMAGGNSTGALFVDLLQFSLHPEKGRRDPKSPPMTSYMRLRIHCRYS